MKIREVIAYIDEFHPNNVSEGMKLRFINEVEAYIQREVMLLRDIKEPYTSEDMETELLAPPQYDEIYTAYIDAKLFYMHHDTAQYEYSKAKYNEIKTSYAGWYAAFNKREEGEAEE